MLAHRGIEYCIILDRKCDYFDIIPDLEKITKRRIEFRDNKILTIIPMKETDDRLLQSSYFNSLKDDWFNFSTNQRFGCDEDVIDLLDLEKHLLTLVRYYIFTTSYRIADEGWYDVAYIVR